MNKLKILSVVTSAMLLMPFVASASSSIPNVKFDNGQTTTSCTAGQTVNMTFRVNTPIGEVVELGQVDVLGDSLAPALPSMLGSDLGLQEGPNDVTMQVTCPQNTGYYTVQFSTAGIYGGQRAVTMNDGVTSTASFTNAIRVVASGYLSQGPNTGGVSNDQLSALLLQISSLQAQISCITAGNAWTSGVGTSTGSCAPKPVTKPSGCDTVIAYNGYNASAAQQSLFGVAVGAAVFQQNGVYGPTGHFAKISAQAAAAVALACK